jgi:hypothetical protein
MPGNEKDFVSSAARRRVQMEFSLFHKSVKVLIGSEIKSELP